MACLGSQTLKTLRPNSIIYMYNKPLYTKDEIPDLTEVMYQFEENTEIDALIKDKIVDVYYKPEKEFNEKILIVKNHSDDIIEKVLNEIDVTLSANIFFFSELNIDPVNNCMVPKHRLATKEELENLKLKKILFSSLPVLKVKDPIRRWHNFSDKSIVAIERNENDVYFRRIE